MNSSPARSLIILGIVIGAIFFISKGFPWGDIGSDMPSIQSEIEQSYGAQPIVLLCNDGEELNISYTEVSSSPGPGAIVIPETRTIVEVQLPNKEVLNFSRLYGVDSDDQYYVDPDENYAFILEDSGASARLEEQGEVLYDGCVLK